MSESELPPLNSVNMAAVERMLKLAAQLNLTPEEHQFVARLGKMLQPDRVQQEYDRARAAGEDLRAVVIPVVFATLLAAYADKWGTSGGQADRI